MLKHMKWLSSINFRARLYENSLQNVGSQRSYYSFRNQKLKENNEYNRWWSFGAAVTMGISSLTLIWTVKQKLDEDNVAHAEQKEYPIYTKEEVAKHKNKQTRIWVTYKGGVYDITEFVDSHPGGIKILLAAGSAIDPFWAIYAAHDTPETRTLIETMKIGELSKAEIPKDTDDPYHVDPDRHPSMVVRTSKPFNAETSSLVLVDNFNTPNDLFYVRNHLPVPVIDPNQFILEIRNDKGQVIQQLNMDDLKTKFEIVTINAALQCSGNRRNELNHVKPVKGLEWGTNAIGNASWTGVRLRDVLKYIGFKPDDRIHHVVFEGLDIDASGVPYGSSIPIEKAYGEYGDVILAFEMNGQELPRDHGYPLRALVPGITGARSVKWLNKIILSEKESDSFWQQKDYKSFPPQIDWHNVDWSTAPAIQESPVQSAIIQPVTGALETLDDDLVVKGYAWSGGGRSIIRVDVSIDGGKNWQIAELKNPTTQNKSYNRAWSWTPWEIKFPIPSNVDKVDIVCKAVDSSYNVQPEFVAPLWNLRGVLVNSWHHVRLDLPNNQ